MEGPLATNICRRLAATRAAWSNSQTKLEMSVGWNGTQKQ
jgi:hypothetical protein